MVAATWSFGRLAVDKASELLSAGASAVDAIEAGIRVVESNNDGQYYVGRGGLPNENGARIRSLSRFPNPLHPRFN